MKVAKILIVLCWLGIGITNTVYGFIYIIKAAGCKVGQIEAIPYAFGGIILLSMGIATFACTNKLIPKIK